MRGAAGSLLGVILFGLPGCHLLFSSPHSERPPDAATADRAPPPEARSEAARPEATVGEEIAFSNVRPNQELETGFIIGTATGGVTRVTCSFDADKKLVVANGTDRWKCPKPTGWRVGSPHTITAVPWNASTSGAGVSVTVYEAQNHDFDGDGYADLAVGTPSADGTNGGVAVYYGGPAGISSASPDLVIPPPTTGSRFGASLVAADLRKTGYADLVVGVGSFGPPVGSGTVYFYYGGSSGLPAAPSSSSAGPALYPIFGSYALAAGDYNGDGHQDVALGYGEASNMGGALFLFRGGPGGVLADGTSSGAFGNRLGEHVALADIYGTGYAALLVGGLVGADSTSVMPGGAGGITNSPAQELAARGSIRTAFIRRDGRADVVIAGNAEARVYYGGSAGLSGATLLSDPPQMGWGEVTAGDLDLDGHDEVLLANSCSIEGCLGGNVMVFRGGSSGVATAAAQTITGAGQFGYSLGLGDWNGDGYLDLALSTSAPSVQIYYGTAGATPFPSSPSLILSGPYGLAAFSPR